MVTGVVAGAILGIALILLARSVRAESRIFSVALMLLPLVYVAFALAAREWDAAVLELALGAPFILAGALCLTFRTPISVVAIGLLWVIHAAYDISHDRLLVNSGVPGWYPLFCATLDMVVGFYVIWLASILPRGTAAFSSAAAPTGSDYRPAHPAVTAEPVHR